MNGTSSTEVGFSIHVSTHLFTDLSIADLKPENLLYLAPAAHSPLVLADFGIAKALASPAEVLTSMAGSFGYAAPEVMLKEGHGKAVDMWSLGVITYTLLCGYSPFRAENMSDLIEETRSGRIVFHERYWRHVSRDAKDFILTLLQPNPNKRSTSKVALKHQWLTGLTAGDRDLLPEIRTYNAKSRLKRGIEVVKLANRIEALKVQEDEEGDIPNPEDIKDKAPSGLASLPKTSETLDPGDSNRGTKKRSLSRIARGAIFREVVLAKVREMKANEERERIEREARENKSAHT